MPHAFAPSLCHAKDLKLNETSVLLEVSASSACVLFGGTDNRDDLHDSMAEKSSLSFAMTEPSVSGLYTQKPGLCGDIGRRARALESQRDSNLQPVPRPGERMCVCASVCVCVCVCVCASVCVHVCARLW
jgi:hypothetical protein